MNVTKGNRKDGGQVEKKNTPLDINSISTREIHHLNSKDLMIRLKRKIISFLKYICSIVLERSKIILY